MKFVAMYVAINNYYELYTVFVLYNYLLGEKVKVKDYLSDLCFEHTV